MNRFFLLSFVILFACGPSSPSAGGADALVTDDPCSGSEARCVGSSYQVCQDGLFRGQDACSSAEVCSAELGCIECLPEALRLCVDDEVHTCNADGTIGDWVDTCGPQQCSNGACTDDECIGNGTQLIYVVDSSNRLLSFDPSKLGTPTETFSLIGTMNCPAGAAWPDWVGTSQPFSMSVDRDGKAWVLYTSGEIFSVSTENASCQATGFQKGQGTFKLFGMGFVADSAGSNEETLFIGGGPVDASGSGDLGSIDKSTLQVTSIAPLPNAEYSPEFTGTGDAELYAYYPGTTNSSIARMSKTSATNEQVWTLPSLTGTVLAWAFAHWGGKFYIFVTTSDALGLNMTSQVHELDPLTSQSRVVPGLENIDYIIVGAGVSTCAPVYVP